jgi:biopolymer transport protein ExbD
MGEVNTEQRQKGGEKGGIVKKGKKMSTRIDMTPMVDLAALLLTFFILATTFIKPQVMQLVLPEKNQEDTNQPKVNEKNVLNIVLGADNKLYWYIGFTLAQVQETNYTDTGLRKVLQEQSKLNDKLVVLVKPQDESTYENLVDTLDELTINSIARYALVDFAPEDKALIDAFTGGSPAPAQVGG